MPLAYTHRWEYMLGNRCFLHIWIFADFTNFKRKSFHQTNRRRRKKRNQSKGFPLESFAQHMTIDYLVHLSASQKQQFRFSYTNVNTQTGGIPYRNSKTITFQSFPHMMGERERERAGETRFVSTYMMRCSVCEIQKLKCKNENFSRISFWLHIHLLISASFFLSKRKCTISVHKVSIIENVYYFQMITTCGFHMNLMHEKIIL